MMNIRFRWLSLPRFQLLIVSANLLSLLGFGAITYFQYRRSFDFLHHVGVKSGLNPTHGFFRFLDLSQKSGVFYLLIAFLFGAALSTIAMLLFSHYLVGPIQRFKSYLEKISKDGETEPLRFRENDYLKDLPPLIEAAFAKIRSDARSSVIDHKNPSGN